MMESSYGIGITNRYSCFLDNEDDPVEALKATEVDKESKKKGKIAEKENRGKDSGDATPTQKSGSTVVNAPAPRKGIRDSNKSGIDAKQPSNRINNGGVPTRGGQRGGGATRPGERPPFVGDRKPQFNNEDDREERNNRRNLNRDENREGRQQDGENRRGRVGGPGGFRGGRGPPRGAGPRGSLGERGERPPGGERPPMRKREFDRQSGDPKSGVKPIDKRDGAGSRNWGTYKDDIEAVTETPAADETMEEKNETSGEITDAGVAGDEKAADQNEEPTEPAEEQPKLMTLDEWKALQQPRQKPVFNLRKAGEGEDQTQWKKMILKKKEKEEHSGDEEEYEEDYDCPQRAGRQKQVLEIDFHFTDSRRGGSGRGGRGGRGEGRGGIDRERVERSGTGRGEERGGGERGGRGRAPGERGGGFRGGARTGQRDRYPPRQTAPKVDDVNDFPSLG